MAGTAQFNGEVGNIESNINKVDSFDESISEDAARQKYPSIWCLKNMVHIVESGISGIWSYRKWSDGTAECWGTIPEITVTKCESWSSIYIADGVITEQTYPFNFIEIPKCTITPKLVSYNFWIYPFSKGTVSATGKYSIARGNNASNFAIQADLYVIGKWK